MNKKYYLQIARTRGPGYFIAIIIVAILYFFFRDWLFTNSYTAPVAAVAIILSVVLGNVLTDYNSFITISNGIMSFHKIFQKKWSLPISEVSTVEEHSRSLRYIERASRHIGGRPRTGVRLTTISGKTYEAEYGDRLVKYKALVENLQQLNPNIKSIPNPNLVNWENL